jgi:hypothetical protein
VKNCAYGPQDDAGGPQDADLNAQDSEESSDNHESPPGGANSSSASFGQLHHDKSATSRWRWGTTTIASFGCAVRPESGEKATEHAKYGSHQQSAHRYPRRDAAYGTTTCAADNSRGASSRVFHHCRMKPTSCRLSPSE